MTRLVCVITLLTTALATMHAAGAAAQTPTDRATSIGASVYFEAPSFGHLGISGDNRLRGVSAGVSVQIHRALTNQVRVGVEMDFAAAHVWRGPMPVSVNEDVVDLPAVQSFRFTTFSPVVSFKVGSTTRWEFLVSGGLVFTHAETGGATTTLPASSTELEPTPTAVSYTVGFTTGFSAGFRATPSLTVVADLRVAAVSFDLNALVRGLLIRPGVGIRFNF